jgi:hypothetical protein
MMVNKSSTEQELIDILKAGERLCKVPRVGAVPEFRRFFVSSDETCLCWESERKTLDKAKSNCAYMMILSLSYSPTLNSQI